jgi:hypothetical protein
VTALTVTSYIVSTNDLEKFNRAITDNCSEIMARGGPLPTVLYHPTQDGARITHNALIVGYFTKHQPSELSKES